MKHLVLFLILSPLLVSCFHQVNPEQTQLSRSRVEKSAYAPGTRLLDDNDRPYIVDEDGIARPYDGDDDYSDDKRVQRRSCRSVYENEDSDVEFTVKNLKYIDAHNITDYFLEGRCDSGEKISITANGYPIDNDNFYCRSSKWKITIDLTPLAGEEEISFEFATEGETFCEDIKVAFTSPKNYVSIPGLEDYYESSFYAMKYEAKHLDEGVNSKAVSEAKDRPIANISHGDALTLCRNNGRRYDLMTNEQWQTIARNVALVDENWSLKRAKSIEGNILNCGVSRGGARAASRTDSDDCAGSRCGRGWHYDRRTHLLSTGDRIWDLCGNVEEMMKDHYTKGISFKDYVYKAKSKIKEMFGPKQTFHTVSSGRHLKYFGLGELDIKSGSSLIVRGGGREAGIFSAEVTRDITSRSSSGIGFRCVYLP